ncbi:N-acetyl-gamma-glutamyl-phosphate reductase [Quillaja saponaria]|uniref:N-acetyl-gamma-glutamyl-phosphate reductase n=1 Tax=Quillaja saponaria TaxID=32244 RepID=A0AAD7P887_QUISA|nr:N-acetyl-gamma-glutamyl-phosphate reductase [Quillaja saponaria]
MAFSSISFDTGCFWKTSQKTMRIGILGACGYTGSEVLRLLENHHHFGVILLTADRKAGQPIASVFPHLRMQELPDLVAIKDAIFSAVDAIFCCLPHGTTQTVDLSADFRLQNISEYEEWYGQPHRAPDLQKEAVYGLTEISREEITNAHLANLIEHKNIIIDSKSGVSGAGRSAKEAYLFTEVTEGVYSYGVTKTSPCCRN